MVVLLVLQSSGVLSLIMVVTEATSTSSQLLPLEFEFVKNATATYSGCSSIFGFVVEYLGVLKRTDSDIWQHSGCPPDK